MASPADTLARARVAAATGLWPADLAHEVVDLLADLAPVAERVEARDVLLRRAAAHVSGSRWAKARRIAREIQALATPPRLRQRADDDGVRDLVALALENAPAPTSFRQLRRVLG